MLALIEGTHRRDVASHIFAALALFLAVMTFVLVMAMSRALVDLSNRSCPAGPSTTETTR